MKGGEREGEVLIDKGGDKEKEEENAEDRF